MTRREALGKLLRRLLGRDDPPTLVAQMRTLWGLAPTWSVPTSTSTARKVSKPQTLDEWKRLHERKRA